MQALRTLSWIVCGIYATIPVYWLMLHPFVARWRGVRYRLTLLVPFWFLAWCLAWAASYPWRSSLLYHNAGTWVAAPLLWSISAFMYVHAARELSFMRLIGQHELEPDRHPMVLVTFGVHRMVRHPMYLGHLCTMLGFTLGAGTLACFGLLIFALISGSIMIVFEERELHARFGRSWEEYCEQTPAIFPLPKG
jgi:protein-S-isoprenylcysteine O-methyltransferase Ste14